MQNIELKARYPSLPDARKHAESVGAQFAGQLHQVDTYFTVRKGRLKLREIRNQTPHLIFYIRPDTGGTRKSNYYIYPVKDATGLKNMLEAALGIRCIVQKQRELHLYDEVRIHLDSVKDLGTFLEFEGVLEGEAPESEIQRKVDWLTQQFGIQENDIIAGSYSDLIASRMSR